MDNNVAVRLDSRRGNELYDARFATKVADTARSYIESGVRVLNFYICDFDAATDITEMLQPVTDVSAFANVDRNNALCFRHPATFTQMLVLTTYIAQILFGSKQARSVEMQGEDDAPKADDINALLAWNDTKGPIYSQGWLWIWNSIVYNRGIFYERAAQDEDVVREPVEEDDLTKPMVPLLRRDGAPRVKKDGSPIMGYQKRQRMRNKIVLSGFYNALDIVSPYDFICDPSLPFIRFQEGRYSGHRVMIPWHELKRRSELDPEDDSYVLPATVWKVKNARQNAITPAGSNLGGTPGLNTSRTYYERTLRNGGIAGGGIGGNGVGAGAGTDGVNKDDGGTVECFTLFIRAKPKTLLMYDDNEFEIINMLVTSSGDVLSVNVQPNSHNQFPYAPSEGLPSAVRQFTPGWGLKCKPVQDRMDNLNTVHTKAQSRMGNIIGVDDTKCDVSNLLSPDKNGLLIYKRKEGSADAWENIIHQIKLTDTTANYNDEMAMWEKILEDMTGANAYTQGQTEDPSQTLGQFDAVRQMAVGRVSSIARLISEQGLMPQTRRFVLNFQQFMPEQMMVRITGKTSDFDPSRPQPKYKVIEKANIQGNFDVIPHDGSLPGADAKIVAAAARTIEAFATNPTLSKAFDTTIPGAIDITRVFRDLLEKSGLPVEKYAVSTEEAQRNAQAALGAQGQFGPAAIPPTNGATPPAPPMIQTPNGGIPSAAALPVNPAAAPPQLNGRTT